MIARQFEQSLMNRDLFLVVCAVAVVLGNIFPVFMKFKGGKGVNTSLGAVLTLLPWETLICVGVFFLVAFIWRYISLGSIMAACSLLVILLLEKYGLGYPVAQVYIYLSLALAAAIVIAHRQNIKRILAGEENRFSLSSKSGKAGSHV